MSTSIRTSITATLLIVAAIIGAAGPASALPGGDQPTDLTSRPSRCTVVPAEDFHVEIDETGAGNISIVDDGVTNCNEGVMIWTMANSSADIDHQEPLVDWLVIMVAELEAAGAKGIDFSLDLDPCWAGFQVYRDGDSLVHEEMIGDGCEMTVAVDFAGPPADAEIHVVQQTGTIAPPHMWTVNDDHVTNLTGMPSGTWYVKVYDGFVPDSSISVGPHTTYADTVYGVGNNATVDIEIATEFGLSAKATTTPSPSHERRGAQRDARSPDASPGLVLCSHRLLA